LADSPDQSTIRQPKDGTAPRSVPRLSWTDSRGEQEAVVDRIVVVGSASKAELCVADRSVSRLHAELQPSAEGLWVRDLGSTNGTYSGGLRVREACFPPGSKLRLGAVELLVSAAHAPGEDASTVAFGGLVGGSPLMRRLFAELGRVAASNASVLIRGETGTGKELCARAIHDASPRAAGPFVVIDCAALPESILENELFGHVRGAFTGALTTRAGAFEEANGGTVFLDEVGELSLPMQPKLLRVLESQRVRRLGETAARQLDIRVIAATHRDLAGMVACSAFREDLYFRLAVVPVRMPSLREHPEDIAELLRGFLGRPAEDVYGAQLLAELASLPWLGNVRELRNFADRTQALGVEAARALVSSLGAHPSVAPGTLTPEAAEPTAGAGASPPAADAAAAPGPFKDFRERWIDQGEADYVRRLLARHGGNVVAAAREAGLNRSHLYRLIKKHAL